MLAFLLRAAGLVISVGICALTAYLADHLHHTIQPFFKHLDDLDDLDLLDDSSGYMKDYSNQTIAAFGLLVFISVCAGINVVRLLYQPSFVVCPDLIKHREHKDRGICILLNWLAIVVIGAATYVAVVSWGWIEPLMNLNFGDESMPQFAWVLFVVMVSYLALAGVLLIAYYVILPLYGYWKEWADSAKESDTAAGADVELGPSKKPERVDTAAVIHGDEHSDIRPLNRSAGHGAWLT